MRETIRLEDIEVANRKKMSPAERAKQFMPFAALKGYEEALAEKEKRIVKKVDLSEERLEELDWVLQQLQKGSMVRVIYYNHSEYIEKEGMVSRMDLTARIITVVQTKIPLDTIYELEILDER